MQAALAWIIANRLTVLGALFAAFSAANSVLPMVDGSTLTVLGAVATWLGIHVAGSAHASARKAHARLDQADKGGPNPTPPANSAAVGSRPDIRLAG